ncbi:hypothetical protein ACQJBY_001858 [Aegilops geniculata]
MALLVRAPPLLHLQPFPTTAQAFFVRQLARTPRRRPLSARVRVRASNSDPPQQRSEALGLCLAAFSAALPYLGRFLEGAGASSRVPLLEGSKQVFVIPDDLSTAQKEDMAWATYVLLQNTNTTSVLIAIGNVLCIRGYWDPPADISKYAMIDWFKSQMEQAGLDNLSGALYFPNFSDTQFGNILPQGILSVLAQPIVSNPDPANGESKAEGVVLLASNANYAYSGKDMVWIRTVANKFRLA